MTKFDEIFETVKNNKNYEENARIMKYVGNILQNAKRISKEESECVKNFAVGEMKRLLSEIPLAETYKEKDKMFFYEDSLLMVFTFAGGSLKNANEEQLEIIKKIVNLVSEESVVENAVDELFQLETVEKSDMEKAIGVVEPLTDEYRRSIFYQKLNEHKEKLHKLAAEAKSMLAEFVADDMERLLNDAENLDEDKINSLEFSADICKYFISDRIIAILKKLMSLKINRVRYYALETLLHHKQEIPADAVKELAEDLSYAELTYSLLKRYLKEALFPDEFAAPEYLAKSELVHWLTYPTELDKEPDEIKLLDTIKVKKDLYYVFLYKSDSDNLSDDLKNEYLIGWSGDCGTFSNFDKYSDYEKKTPQKTLKYIAKKLLK